MPGKGGVIVPILWTELKSQKVWCPGPPGGEWGMGIHSQLCSSPKPMFVLGYEHLFGPGRDLGLQIQVGFSWPYPLWYTFLITHVCPTCIVTKCAQWLAWGIDKGGRRKAPVSLHFCLTQRCLHGEQALTTSTPKEFSVLARGHLSIIWKWLL